MKIFSKPFYMDEQTYHKTNTYIHYIVRRCFACGLKGSGVEKMHAVLVSIATSIAYCLSDLSDGYAYRFGLFLYDLVNTVSHGSIRGCWLFPTEWEDSYRTFEEISNRIPINVSYETFDLWGLDAIQASMNKSKHNAEFGLYEEIAKSLINNQKDWLNSPTFISEVFDVIFGEGSPLSWDNITDGTLFIASLQKFANRLKTIVDGAYVTQEDINMLSDVMRDITASTDDERAIVSTLKKYGIPYTYVHEDDGPAEYFLKDINAYIKTDEFTKPLLVLNANIQAP